ncbi:histone-lysine N-methyltransferase SETMAR-like [Octopus sinensis]|uniref:Histone-lysine N-methyltransferase SETMAR-like n=1 Tax=Octopus sinensis TaxID=2607531 RepID=A0A6P7T309_9MOLL|nr:histone-lysine N-methyltransferase SETMAR-like [Octopus sinensis]
MKIKKIGVLKCARCSFLRNTSDPFLDQIVTCDEKWTLYDNRKRSGQWLDHDESPKYFPKPKLHQQKVMVTAWWSAIGVVHYSFLEASQSITAKVYCNQRAEMHAHLQKMRPALVNRRDPILLYDNAKSHVTRMTLQEITDLGYEILPDPPYSDLSPTDYHFLKHLNTFFSDKTFRFKLEVDSTFKDFLTSKPISFYQRGINNLVDRWQRCSRPIL